MARGMPLIGTRKKLAVAAAAAGLVLAFSGQAQAADYEKSTDDGCASVVGAYDYQRVGTAGGYPLYNTSWDFKIWDNCSDGRGAGLFTTYRKWESGEWKYHSLTKLGSDTNGFNGTPGYAKDGRGYNVRDVGLYVCFIEAGGYANWNSCRGLL
ncbi:Tat pathway signal protein [Streptomyces sp. NBC_00377]|uniref:Tat pathway signal protein n=1 Tax=unclassified Streptomyces TaxID=2593676 RepID=UPI002E1FC2CD|nr:MULTISPECIES: Tat pathway signal protein [unclassified Streptomyces]